jgi:MFS transporter, putative metabolite:H+ symporter
MKNSEDGSRGNYKDLFNSYNMKTSLILFTLWFIVSYIYYGLIYILPTVYEKITLNEYKSEKVNDKLYETIVSEIIISCIFEFPSNIANGILPNLVGRKHTIIYGFIGSGIFSCLCLFSLNMIPLYAGLTKALINISFTVLYIYTSEAYPTYMRATGLGMCNFFSRIGGFTTPFINGFLVRISNYLPFLGFGLTSFIGVILTLFIKETKEMTTY